MAEAISVNSVTFDRC